MIASLFLTSTGNVILALLIVGVLGWCAWRTVLTIRQRKVLIDLVRRTDDRWHMKTTTLEKTFYKHLRRNVFCRGWKDLYRPAFYAEWVNSRQYRKREEP